MPGFSSAVMKEVEGIFQRYPRKEHALLPLIHLVLRENKGCVPEEWDQVLADMVGVSLNHVRGVITFYDMLQREPRGKHHIRVCTSIPCGLCGGDKVLERMEDALGIHAGQTTPDGMISLEEVQCIAACDKAPLIQVDDHFAQQVDPDRVEEVVAAMRRK
ncbi:MAG: NAD(P)H-dependent oxidoreductase subunit E [Deltaproteobacteria bacterium]|nr:NAD(P)H-dependent oxidoreductase subunit E [Deltaproteobacteria bacterium]